MGFCQIIDAICYTLLDTLILVKIALTLCRSNPILLIAERRRRDCKERDKNPNQWKLCLTNVTVYDLFPV